PPPPGDRLPREGGRARRAVLLDAAALRGLPLARDGPPAVTRALHPGGTPGRARGGVGRAPRLGAHVPAGTGRLAPARQPDRGPARHPLYGVARVRPEAPRPLLGSPRARPGRGLSRGVSREP